MVTFFSTSPYPGFRYTLPVPTVRWVHFFVPKTIGMHTFFYRSYDVSTKNLVLTYFGV